MNLSIVDVSAVQPGGTRPEALRHSLELAERAEAWGYERYWVAEHHGAASIAGRAPEVLIAALAAPTSRIRLGSGSVLLNHYSAFKVAEVFCTLNELYPGRIDLGVGRATTGPVLDVALQQDRDKRFHPSSDQHLAELVAWLERGFPPGHPFAEHPIHTEGLPELHLLGSSPWSASAAAQLGLRYVFAGFINQQGTPGILDAYRRSFVRATGAVRVERPEVILGIHVVCADTEDEARRQLAPVHVMYANLARGDLRSPLLSPEDAVRQIGALPRLEPYRRGSRVPPRFCGRHAAAGRGAATRGRRRPLPRRPHRPGPDDGPCSEAPLLRAPGGDDPPLKPTVERVGPRGLNHFDTEGSARAAEPRGGDRRRR